jgi:hypothetical protein
VRGAVRQIEAVRIGGRVVRFDAVFAQAVREDPGLLAIILDEQHAHAAKLGPATDCGNGGRSGSAFGRDVLFEHQWCVVPRGPARDRRQCTLPRSPAPAALRSG